MFFEKILCFGLNAFKNIMKISVETDLRLAHKNTSSLFWQRISEARKNFHSFRTNWKIPGSKI